MASLYEQMDDLLTPDSVKKGLAESAEKNKDMSMSDIFSFDRFKKEALPQFRDKEEIIEKATASGTGLLTGTLGLPSDIVSLASAGADVADKYIGPIADPIGDAIEEGYSKLLGGAKKIGKKIKQKIKGNKKGNFVEVPVKLARTKPTRLY